MLVAYASIKRFKRALSVFRYHFIEMISTTLSTLSKCWTIKFYANKLRNVNDWRMAFFNADADVVAVNRVQVILNSI